MAPFTLFTTLARDPRRFERFVARGYLGKGHLTLRQRELVIARTTALAGSEYEWGIHVHFFADSCGFDADQLRSILFGDATDPCWSDEGDRILIELSDALHTRCDVDDRLSAKLRNHFPEEAILKLLVVAGNYRSVAYITNALRLRPESGAPTFATTCA